MIHRFRQVTKNLFRGSAPTPSDVLYLKNEFGIKKIVSLDKASADRIDRTTKILGIKHIIIPLDWRRLSVGKLLHFNLKKLFLEDGPTFVHCAAGKDRTGLAVALVQCKYLGKDPEDAILEAKTLGFGVGIDPRVTHLYENIIRKCKSEKDNNNADIVSNERDYIGDNRDTALDEGRLGSFAPYLNETQQNPMNAVYNAVNDQSPTRENYPDYKVIKKHICENCSNTNATIPLCGIFNNDSGLHGAGPHEPVGGFISD